MVKYLDQNRLIKLFFCLLMIGFNNFMEDIRMMLGRRPFEPYWFFTWCISGPIITFVRKHLLLYSSLDCFYRLLLFHHL